METEGIWHANQQELVPGCEGHRAFWREASRCLRPCLAWSTQDERQTWEEEKVVTWACLVSGKVRIFGELSAVSRVVTEAKEDNETPKGRQRRVAQGPQDGVGPCPALQPRCHPLSRQVAPLTTPFLQGGGGAGPSLAARPQGLAQRPHQAPCIHGRECASSTH